MNFEDWKKEYGLVYEPNYSLHTEMDCMAAFKAGQQSKQQKLAIHRIPQPLRSLLYCFILYYFLFLTLISKSWQNQFFLNHSKPTNQISLHQN